MALAVALIGGLLGTVALGALAGARRTDSAYGRYLRSVNASDVLVNIPGPLLPAIRDVEHEPEAVSSAAWIGLNADPVIHGRVISSFLTDGLTGTLDGEFFRQDKLTVLAGHLPSPSAGTELVINPGMASAYRLVVGEHMTWQFYRAPTADGLPTGAPPRAAQRVTFVIAAIVSVPPALDDEFDDVPGAFLSPAATASFLNGEWQFGWAALRLRHGDAGVPALRRQLAGLASRLTRTYHFPLSFTIRRLALVKQQAQQAIEPQALALAVLGGLAAIALLALMALGLAQLLGRTAADARTLRAIGASRREAAIAAGGWGAVAVGGAVISSVGGALAVSPLAPIGPVRQFDPVRGVEADWLVLGGGAAALLVLLTAQLTWLAWRAVRQDRELATTRPSALVAAVSHGRLPVYVVTGIRHALERGSGQRRAPVRATLAGSVIAVTALVAALVFGASLANLVTHPSKYGWNWSVVVQSEGGYGSWPPGSLDRAVSGQHGLTGWSEFGFAQLTIRGTEVPVIGVLRHPGARTVEPPTTSGHPLTGPDQIEFGTVTMRQLGLHVGEQVRVDSYRTPLTVVGTVTLPSFGVQLQDNVSLGRGAMLPENTLLSALGLALHPTFDQVEESVASPAYPATAAFDVGSPAQARALAASLTAYIDRAGQEPGGAYSLGPQLGAPVVNASQTGNLPVVLASAVAVAALLALGLTLLASVRQRRRDLALLKALGLRARQVRAIIAWQTTAILALATVVGLPLGVVAGQWAWTRFAAAIGVVPEPTVPLGLLVLGLAGLLVAANVLAAAPAIVAARIPAAATLRTE
jgi:FtsX-like permease family